MKTLANISTFESLMNGKPVQVNNWFGFGSQAPKKFDFSDPEMRNAYEGYRRQQYFSSKLKSLVPTTNRLLASARELQGMIFTCTEGGGTINQYRNMKDLATKWNKAWNTFRQAAHETQSAAKQVFQQVAKRQNAQQGNGQAMPQGTSATYQFTQGMVPQGMPQNNPQPTQQGMPTYQLADGNNSFTVQSGNGMPQPKPQPQPTGQNWGPSFAVGAQTPEGATTNPSISLQTPNRVTATMYGPTSRAGQAAGQAEGQPAGQPTGKYTVSYTGKNDVTKPSKMRDRRGNYKSFTVGG